PPPITATEREDMGYGKEARSAILGNRTGAQSRLAPAFNLFPCKRTVDRIPFAQKTAADSICCRNQKEVAMATIDRRVFLKLAAASGLAHIPGALPSAYAADPYALAKQQGKAVFYAN